MVVFVYLVNTERGVHFIIGACVSTYEFYSDRFVSFKATRHTEQLSVNVPEGLKPYYVLVSFDQGVVPQSPFDATVFVAYGYVPYNPDWLVDKIACQQLLLNPFNLLACIIHFLEEGSIAHVARLCVNRDNF